MEPVPILFGIGCAVAYAAAARSRDAAAREAASHLIVVWGLANAAWLADMLWLLPVFDLVLGFAVLQSRWMTDAEWLDLVVDAIGIRLVLHVLDALTSHLFLTAYLHALNAAFVWMLFVVATSGGGYGGHNLRARFRHTLHSLARASRKARWA